MDFLFTIAGFSVGFIIGMTGVGGGSLMTPILVLGFSIPPVIAVGTDLLYAAITKSVGVFAHHKHGNIKWKVVGLLSMGSIPASIGTIFAIKYFNNAGINYDQLILSSLSFAMILTAIFLIFRDQWHKLGKKKHFAFLKIFHQKPIKEFITNYFTILAGVLIGALVTLSSVGAGVIGAAFLFFLYPKYRTIEVIATDLAHAIPITAIAGIGHANLGTVDYILLLGLIIGSLPGIYLGSQVGNLIPDKIMRGILAGMLLIIGVLLML